MWNLPPPLCPAHGPHSVKAGKGSESPSDAGRLPAKPVPGLCGPAGQPPWGQAPGEGAPRQQGPRAVASLLSPSPTGTAGSAGGCRGAASSLSCLLVLDQHAVCDQDSRQALWPPGFRTRPPVRGCLRSVKAHRWQLLVLFSLNHPAPSERERAVWSPGDPRNPWPGSRPGGGVGSCL